MSYWFPDSRVNVLHEYDTRERSCALSWLLYDSMTLCKLKPNGCPQIMLLRTVFPSCLTWEGHQTFGHLRIGMGMRHAPCWLFMQSLAPAFLLVYDANQSILCFGLSLILSWWQFFSDQTTLLNLKLQTLNKATVSMSVSGRLCPRVFFLPNNRNISAMAYDPG
jgi:hypothetical protein